MFDDFEGRLYHEVLLNHQHSNSMSMQGCTCGWKQTFGIDTYCMHLAATINAWTEANFIFIDKV